MPSDFSRPAGYGRTVPPRRSRAAFEEPILYPTAPQAASAPAPEDLPPPAYDAPTVADEPLPVIVATNPVAAVLRRRVLAHATGPVAAAVRTIRTIRTPRTCPRPPRCALIFSLLWLAAAAAFIALLLQYTNREIEEQARGANDAVSVISRASDQMLDEHDYAMAAARTLARELSHHIEGDCQHAFRVLVDSFQERAIAHAPSDELLEWAIDLAAMFHMAPRKNCAEAYLFVSKLVHDDLPRSNGVTRSDQARVFGKLVKAVGIQAPAIKIAAAKVREDLHKIETASRRISRSYKLRVDVEDAVERLLARANVHLIAGPGLIAVSLTQWFIVEFEALEKCIERFLETRADTPVLELLWQFYTGAGAPFIPVYAALLVRMRMAHPAHWFARGIRALFPEWSDSILFAPRAFVQLLAVHLIFFVVCNIYGLWLSPDESALQLLHTYVGILGTAALFIGVLGLLVWLAFRCTDMRPSPAHRQWLGKYGPAAATAVEAGALAVNWYTGNPVGDLVEKVLLTV